MIFSHKRRAVILALAIFTGTLAASNTVAAPAPHVATVSTVRYGSRGNDVRIVQQRFRDLGYVIAVDGIFGPKTRAVAMAFQRANGLYVDGIVGPRTQAKLWPTQPPPAATGGYHHPDPKVERWHALAVQAGWPESQWQKLSCVIYRESRGNPLDKTGTHWGLLQIDVYHWEVRYEVGGWGSSENNLLDGGFNLRVGRALYRRSESWGYSGWRPWASTSTPC